MYIIPVYICIKNKNPINEYVYNYYMFIYIYIYMLYINKYNILIYVILKTAKADIYLIQI